MTGRRLKIDTCATNCQCGWGGLAANLARVSSFARNPANGDAVQGLIDESKLFIEWTAAQTDSETAEQLVELQTRLAVWQFDWDELWSDQTRRASMAQEARAWSNRVLILSGLVD